MGVVEGAWDDILELMRQIMLRFSVEDRAGLALWVNKALAREGMNVTVSVDSLAASFTNGVAFCALANYCLRSQKQVDLCVDLTALSPTMGISNFNLAMVLLSHAGVPQVLSPDDVASGATDELAIAYLLTQIRRHTVEEQVCICFFVVCLFFFFFFFFL
jgi:hypothetical protein